MKNEVHQTQVESSSSSDSKCNEIGLVICQVLLAADSIKADSWIVVSGAICHICNEKRSFVEIHTLKKSQDVMLGDRHALSASNITLELVLEMARPRGVNYIMYSMYQSWCTTCCVYRR